MLRIVSVSPVCTVFFLLQVPFGRLAFMPGQLHHTNEILVLLGDNWFAMRSAKQASGIVDRRKRCEINPGWIGSTHSLTLSRQAHNYTLHIARWHAPCSHLHPCTFCMPSPFNRSILLHTVCTLTYV